MMPRRQNWGQRGSFFRRAAESVSVLPRRSNSSHNRPKLPKLLVDMPDRLPVIPPPCLVSPKARSPSPA